MNENKKSVNGITDLNGNSSNIIALNASNGNSLIGGDKVVISILECLTNGCARNNTNWKDISYSWNDIVSKISRVVKTAETIEQYQDWKKQGKKYTKEDMSRYGELSRAAKKALEDGEIFEDEEFKRLKEKRLIANAFKNKCSYAKDKGGFISGRFKENSRKEDLMVSRSMLTIDIDGYKGSNLIEKLDTIITKLNINAVVYSTHSHNPAAESYNLRLVIPFNKPLAIEEYKWLSRKFTDLYLVENGKSMVDAASFKPNQIMFYPSCPKDTEYYFKSYVGNYMNTNDYILGYDITKWNEFSWDESEKKEILNKTTYDNKPKTKRASVKTHPHLLNGLAGDFCRMIDNIPNCIDQYFAGDFEYHLNRNRVTNNAVASEFSMQLSDNSMFLYEHDTSWLYTGIMMNAYDMIKLIKCNNNLVAAKEYIVNDKYFNNQMYKMCESLAVEKELKEDNFIYSLIAQNGIIVKAFVNDEKYYFKMSDDSIIEAIPNYYVRVQKNSANNYKIVDVYFSAEYIPLKAQSIISSINTVSKAKEDGFKLLNEIIEKATVIKRGKTVKIKGEVLHHKLLVENTFVIAGTGLGKTHEVAKFIVKNLGNPEIVIASTKNNTNVDDLEKEIKKVIDIYINDKSPELIEWLNGDGLSEIGIYTLTRTGNLGFSKDGNKKDDKIKSVNAIITNHAYFGFVGDKAQYNDNMKAILENPIGKIMIYDEYESLVKDQLMKQIPLNSFKGKNININGALKDQLVSSCLSKFVSDKALEVNPFDREKNELEFAEINYLMDSVLVNGVYEYYCSIDKGTNLKAEFDSMVKLKDKYIFEYMLKDNIPTIESNLDSIWFNLGVQVKRYEVTKDAITDEKKHTNFRMMMNKQEGIAVQTVVIEFFNSNKESLTIVESVEELKSFLINNKIDIMEFKTVLNGLGYAKFAPQLFVDVLEMKIPSIVDHYKETITTSYYLSANRVNVAADIAIDDTLEFITDENITELEIFGIHTDNPDNVIIDLIKNTADFESEVFAVFGNQSSCAKIAKQHLPHVQYRGNMSDDGLNKNTQCTKSDNVDYTTQTTIITYINGTECQGRNLSNSEMIIVPVNFGVNPKGRCYWNSEKGTIELYSKIEMTKKVLRQTLGRILRTVRDNPVSYKAFVLVGNLGIYNHKGIEAKDYDESWTIFEDVVNDYKKFDWDVKFDKNNIYNKNYKTRKTEKFKSRDEIMNYLKALLENKNHNGKNDLEALHFNIEHRKENAIKSNDNDEIKKYYLKIYNLLAKKTDSVKMSDVEKKVLAKFKISRRKFYSLKSAW